MCEFCLKYNNGDCLTYCIADERQRKKIIEQLGLTLLKRQKAEVKDEK